MYELPLENCNSLMDTQQRFIGSTSHLLRRCRLNSIGYSNISKYNFMNDDGHNYLEIIVFW